MQNCEHIWCAKRSAPLISYIVNLFYLFYVYEWIDTFFIQLIYKLHYYYFYSRDIIGEVDVEIIDDVFYYIDPW